MKFFSRLEESFLDSSDLFQGKGEPLRTRCQEVRAPRKNWSLMWISEDWPVEDEPQVKDLPKRPRTIESESPVLIGF